MKVTISGDELGGTLTKKAMHSGHGHMATRSSRVRCSDFPKEATNRDFSCKN